MKCQACGSSNLIEGRITTNTGSSAEYFAPKDRSAFLSSFGIGTRAIINLACVHCGNLQFVVEFNDDDKQRYAKFEGEQPDLMKLIDTDSQNTE